MARCWLAAAHAGVGGSRAGWLQLELRRSRRGTAAEEFSGANASILRAAAERRHSLRKSTYRPTTTNNIGTKGVLNTTSQNWV